MLLLELLVHFVPETHPAVHRAGYLLLASKNRVRTSSNQVGSRCLGADDGLHVQAILRSSELAHMDVRPRTVAVDHGTQMYGRMNSLRQGLLEVVEEHFTIVRVEVEWENHGEAAALELVGALVQGGAEVRGDLVACHERSLNGLDGVLANAVDVHCCE